ncbi:MAG: hypothetical protein KDD47_08475, partial [Acidobacteria bacterium]|nr:hypothetical protein [Acidobacteriota bacterium]
TVIADLVGIAVIRMGTQALYDHALREGDLPTALASAAVLGEMAPQRFLTSDRINRLDVTKEALSYGKKMEVADHVVLRLARAAESGPERRFRIEALLQLAFVSRFGTAFQREKAESLLERLEEDPDPFVAYQARWALEVETQRLRDNLGGVSDE